MINRVKEIFGESILLSNNYHVSVEKFCYLFKDASDFSYSELMKVEQDKNYGYAKYIEEWKAKGLIE